MRQQKANPQFLIQRLEPPEDATQPRYPRHPPTGIHSAATRRHSLRPQHTMVEVAASSSPQRIPLQSPPSPPPILSSLVPQRGIASRWGGSPATCSRRSQPPAAALADAGVHVVAPVAHLGPRITAGERVRVPRVSASPADPPPPPFSPSRMDCSSCRGSLLRWQKGIRGATWTSSRSPSPS
jgi:hypothetical protein